MTSQQIGADAELTPRETDVLRLVGSGRSNQQIADVLGLSMNSVKSYIRAAYRKIDAESRTQALLWCVDHGFVEGPGGAPLAGPSGGAVELPMRPVAQRVVGPVAAGSGADVHQLAQQIRTGLRERGRFHLRLADDDDRDLALLHRAVRAAVLADPSSGTLAVTVSYAQGPSAVAVVRRAS